MTSRDLVLNTFQDHYKQAPTLLARAPGRVNIIGEHTDYNDGFVLPAAIDRAIYFAARPRTDSTVRLVSVDFKARTQFELDNLDDLDLPGWSKYPRGALWWLQDHGHYVPGFDAVIGGDIPIGAGLSSSAAVEVGMIELGLALSGGQMAQVDKALAGVEVEHQFIGMPCGVMDQMASAMGKAGHVLLIDCRTLGDRSDSGAEQRQHRDHGYGQAARAGGFRIRCPARAVRNRRRKNGCRGAA